MRILLTGVTGQVGSELMNTLSNFGEVIPTRAPNETTLFDSVEMDLLDERQIKKTIREHKPNLIVNPAAYTAVDKAEEEAKLATQINAKSPKVMAEEAKSIRAGLIHFSTDYVYSGLGSKPFEETAKPAPASVYGKSKYEGDLAVLSECEASWIVRTSWVWGIQGHNFIKTIIQLSSEKDRLSIVDDQFGAPTSARVLADTVCGMIGSDPKNLYRKMKQTHGVYNVSCDGKTTWKDYATEIINYLTQHGVDVKVKEIVGIATEDSPYPAPRPKNSLLNTNKIREVFGIHPPHWKTALERGLPKILPG